MGGSSAKRWWATPCIDFEGAGSWVLGQLDAIGRGGAAAEAMLGVRVDAEGGSVEHSPNLGPLGAVSVQSALIQDKEIGALEFGVEG